MFYFPFYPPPPPPMFPPIMPIPTGCGCCNRPAPLIEDFELKERKDTSSMSFEDWKWCLNSEAPAGFPVAKVKARQEGYKLYIDGKAFGRGADKAPAYLALKNEEGSSVFSIVDEALDEGTCLPLLAVVGERGTYPTDDTLLTVISSNELDNILRVELVEGRYLYENDTRYEGCGVIECSKVYIKGTTRQGREIEYGEPFNDQYALAGGLS